MTVSSVLSGTTLSDPRLWTRLLSKLLRTLSDATSTGQERVTSSSEHWELLMSHREVLKINELKGHIQRTSRAIIEASKGAAKSQVVPRNDFIDDLLTMIIGTDFTDAELERLYVAVRNKARCKTCCKCGHLGVLTDGDYIWADGDMSKPKQYRCYLCKEKML